jgi:3-phosphoshikimate 1-carboxyvinyltransferase
VVGVRIEPAAALTGHFAVPGDKSISHRSLLLGAVGEGETTITGFGRSADTESTLGAVRALGVRVDDDGDVLRVHGVGLRGLRPPPGPIDCGNAGTLARLLPGLLAFQDGTFTLVGDESLSRRPMERIAEPLRRMGALVETTGGCLPVTITGRPLTGIDFTLPVASAQVKSVVLLAGLGAQGRTTVIEPAPSRDHTELMLQGAGGRVARRPASVSVDPVERLRLEHVAIPGDFSSAAPFVVAATLIAGSDVTVHDVGLNPRRTGLLDVLERMGARVGVVERNRVGMEGAGALEIRSAELVAAEIDAREVPLLIDELPLFALAAACARGVSRVSGARELRLKESDRTEAVVELLRRVGLRAQGQPDGFVITGVPMRPRGGRVDARGDHRIAMLGAVAGLVSTNGVDIDGAETVSISFPDFFDVLDQLAHRPGQLV